MFVINKMDENLKRFVNKGISPIGIHETIYHQEQKTLIVVGVARGGTSLISGALQHLGVFTGDMSSSPVFEDVRLAAPMDKKKFPQAGAIINEYNERYSTWAFKRPSIIHCLDDMHEIWRNPFYLFVFKDIASIANRNVLSMGMDFEKCLFHAQKSYGLITHFLSSNKNINGIAFSFEKLLDNKEYFLEQLISIIGSEITSDQINSANKFITSNPELYLDKSRIVK